jgi:cytochrome c oxidase subunit 1
LHFWLTFASFNVTFLPMHWLGLLGMPRRVPFYDPQYAFWNQVESVGSFVLAGAMLILLYNMVWSLQRGPKAGPNPWGARTLEWMISSPPPYYNFSKIPAVLKTPYDFGNPLPYLNLEAAPGAREATPSGAAPATAPA